jgi:hypothetical protein
VAPAFGMSPGTHDISSSPAVGDIDMDGHPEIAIGVGSTEEGCNTPHHGGVIVLEHDGSVKPGWPKLSHDEDGDGCLDSVSSTPALGNLDDDPQKEIVVGGFDKRIYAWNVDGSPVPGFPPDSYHLTRFPTWEDLHGRVTDTIWSSPALKDIDRDGLTDVIIGTDEGNFDASWGGDANGWICPYEPPPGGVAGYCGGSVYALDASGTIKPGFPRYLLETIKSSPAVADIDWDGYPEVIVGTGTYYYDNSPDQPTHGFVLNAWDRNGTPLPGWPISLGSAVPGSPVVGDITGDAQPEIVVPTWDSRLFAFHHTGEIAPGFPMTPRREQGQTGARFDDMTALGDYDGDGKMEIFLNNGWTVTVIDGDGQQLTGDNFPDNSLPIYYAFGTLLNSPALADIDGDGRLELIVQNSSVYAFDLPAASGKTHWPMFKADAGRNNAPAFLAAASVSHNTLLFLASLDETAILEQPLTIHNTGDLPLTWSLATSPGIALTATSGNLLPEQTASIQVQISAAGYGAGAHAIGEIDISVSSADGTLPDVPTTIAVQLFVGNVHRTYIPAVR